MVRIRLSSPPFLPLFLITMRSKSTRTLAHLLLFTLINFSEAFSESDPFHGSWVYDESYPLYDSAKCPFLDPGFDCLKYGRSDKLYLKYRWKPDAFELPRFDGVEFLKRWKGKRIMFVGDSLSLNQHDSFLCLLHSTMPDSKISSSQTEEVARITKFEEYNVTIMYYLSYYLVDIVRKPIGRVLKLDSIQGGHVWTRSDVLVFNSWNWWLRDGPAQPWDYMQYGNTTLKDMDRTVAFTKGLQTWAKWVDASVNANTTKIFYQGIAPNHYNGQEWGGTSEESCLGQTKPLNTSIYPADPPPQLAIVKDVIRKISKPVYLLDITLLSQLRIDAHPSKYSGIGYQNDCTHWCIAGLPDTWNTLFYSALVQ
ncbi:protein trichome birefringence-like 39 isoform X2 [Typha latifolia]|uniref:protein trichome birefringence-like 39 isoform X2 n=1 Tax=Typha latifolia TaxID=4733 RepID=UPI003C2FBB23